MNPLYPGDDDTQANTQDPSQQAATAYQHATSANTPAAEEPEEPATAAQPSEPAAAVAPEQSVEGGIHRPPTTRPEDHFDFEKEGYDPRQFTGGTAAVFADKIAAAHKAVEVQGQWDNYNAAQAVRQQNAEREAKYRTTGEQSYIDPFGNRVPVYNENGTERFTPKTSDVKYDQNGAAFQTHRDEEGKVTTLDPDADAPIGSHPDAPAQLFKQNKNQGWTPLGSVQDGLQSSDPKIKAAAVDANEGLQKSLLKGATDGFQAQKDTISIAQNAENTKYQASLKQAQGLDSQIEATKAHPEFNAVEGGYFGTQIGSNPTANAKALQAKVATLQQQRDGISLTPPDTKGYKAKMGNIEEQEKAFQALTRTTGSVDGAEAQWRQQVIATGGDVKADPILQALAKKRADLGMSTKSVSSTSIDSTVNQAPPAGQLAPGNIDLNNRPVVKNPDGSISTVRSMSIGVDGKEVLIPTVARDGSGILSDADAITQFKKTGENLGTFDTPDNADAYAQQLHQDQAKQYVNTAPPAPKLYRISKGGQIQFAGDIRDDGGNVVTAPRFKAVRQALDDGKIDQESALAAVKAAAGQGSALDNKVGEVRDAAVRGVIDTSNTLNRSAEGVTRFIGLTGLADQYKSRADLGEQALAGQLAQQFAPAEGEGGLMTAAANVLNVNPALASGPTAKLGMAVGGLVGMAPVMAAGELAAPVIGLGAAAFSVFKVATLAPKIIGVLPMALQSAGEAYASGYNEAKSTGANDVAAADAGNKKAIATLPGLGLYMLTGEASHALMKGVLPVMEAPFKRFLVSGGLQLAGNMAASAGSRKIEGGNASDIAESFPQDAAFAIHGALGEYATAKYIPTARALANGSHPEIQLLRSIGASDTASPEMKAHAAKQADEIQQGAKKFLDDGGFKTVPGDTIPGLTPEATQQLQALVHKTLIDAPVSAPEPVTDTQKNLGVIDTAPHVNRVAEIDKEIAKKQLSMVVPVPREGAMGAVKDAVDGMKRDKVGQQLFDLYRQRMGMVSAINYHSHLQDVGNEIDSISNQTAGLETALPEQLTQAKATASGLVKLATGKPMEALTTGEQAALESPSPDGLPRVDEVKGKPVISDGAIARLKAIAPLSAGMIRESESDRRNSILNPQPKGGEQNGKTKQKTGTQDGSAEGNGATGDEAANEEGGSKGAVEPKAGAAKAAPAGGPMFDVELNHPSKTDGPVSVVRVQAKDEASAKAQVARTIKPASLQSVGEAHPVDAKEPAPGPHGPVDTSNDSDFVKEAVGQVQAQAAGRPLNEGALHAVRHVARVLEPHYNRWQKAFDGVTFSAESNHSAGASFDTGSRKLSISIPDVLRHAKDYSTPEMAARVMAEEAIHAVTSKLESRDATGKATGPVDLVSIYRSLPDSVHKALEGSYLSATSDYQKAHEFWRMWMQGDISMSKDGFKVRGKALTEQVNRKFLVSIRRALGRLFSYFSDMSRQLRASGASEDVIREVERAMGLIRDKVKEVDGIAARTSEGGNESTANQPEGAGNQGATTGEPDASGPGVTRPYAQAQSYLKPLESSARTELANRLKAPEGAIGSQSEVTQNGETMRVAFIVQPSAEARPSHDATGAATPGYDQELQPRDRSLPQYRKQAANIARDLDFSRLSMFPGTSHPATTADIGTPIMTADGDTLTGNGREIAIRLAYSDNSPASRKYKADLMKNAEAFGLDRATIMKMDKPILKRVILDDLSKPDLIKFSQESNEGASMGNNAMENAGRDASRITPQLLAKFDPNYAIDSAKNADFLKAYAGQVIGGAEGNEANMLKSELANRVRMGVFAYAYGMDAEGRAAIERMSGDEADAGGKTITNGLLTAAPLVARLKTDIATGDLYPLDISPAISRAAQDISAALKERPAKQSADVALQGLLDQRSMFDNDSLSRSVLEFLVANRTNRGAIEKGLSNYVESVFRLGSPKETDMFGERDVPQPVELFQRAAAAEMLNSQVLRSQVTWREFPESLGVPRNEMPQVKMSDRDGFIDYLHSKGIRTIDQTVATSTLRPVQAEYSPEKAAKTKEFLGGDGAGRRIIISSDGYVIDGHHQYVAEHGGTSNVIRMSVPVNEAMDAMRSFPKVSKSDGRETAESRFRKILADNQPKHVEGEQPHATVSEPEAITSLVKRFGAEPVQKAIRGYNELRERHAAAKPEFDAEIKRIADQFHSEAMLAGLKGRPRSVEKIITDYDGDANKLNDVLRASIVATKLSDVEGIAHEIHSKFKVFKFKNRFSPPLPSGYSDMMFVAEIKPGVSAEVQVHIPEMIQAKAVAHGLYEKFRSIEKDPDKAAERDELNAQMNDIYRAAALSAIERETSASNSAGDNGSPLVSKFIEIFSDKGAGGSNKQFNGSASGGQAIGMSSESRNLVPGGKSDEEVIPSSTGAVGAGKPEFLNAQRSRKDEGTMSLFGDMEPVAKAYVDRLPEKVKASPTTLKIEVAKDAPDVAANPDAMNDLFQLTQREPKRKSTKNESTKSRRNNAATVDDTGDLFLGGFQGHPVQSGQAEGVDSKDAEAGNGPRSGSGGPGSRGASNDIGGLGTKGNGVLGGADGSGTGDYNSGVSGAVGQGGNGNASGEHAIVRPPKGSPDRNAEIDSSKSYAPRPGRERFDANVDAIRLMRELESQKRNATEAEKQTLLAYTGWGWMKEAFNKVRAEKWLNYQRDLRSAYDAAKQRWDDDQAQSSYSRYSYVHNPGTWEEFEANHASGLGGDENQKLKSWVKSYLPYYEKLRNELTPEEFDSAAKSVRNAHYTDVPIIGAMWKLVERLGFKGGNALEPGAGIGHFIGAQPEETANKTRWNAVELDDVTARILGHLYPEATVNGEHSDPARRIEGQGFQDARVPNNSQDLVISNVPFAKEGPAQSEKEFGHKFNLHNYFFARAFAKAKPGGLVAFITSASTMDNNLDQRQALSAMGDFVGAVRLPNDAFKQNAGTEVTTDIMVFRKPDGSHTGYEPQPWTFTREVNKVPMSSTRPRDMGVLNWIKQQPADWVPQNEDIAAAYNEWVGARRPEGGKRAMALIRAIQDAGESNTMQFIAPVKANEYWLTHPEHALGEHSLEGSMYGPDSYALKPSEGQDTLDAMHKAIETFPENIAGSDHPDIGPERETAGKYDKMGSFVSRGDDVYQVEPDGLTRPEWANDIKQVRKFDSWSSLRDAYNQLISLEINNGSKQDIDDARAHLNDVYDEHRINYGALALSKRNPMDFLQEDPDYIPMQALEVVNQDVDAKGKPIFTYKKADIFSRRQIKETVMPTEAKTIEDAVLFSMTKNGFVHPSYIADLLGIHEQEATQQLIDKRLAFQNPQTGTLDVADSYLSGNVGQKLEAAIEAAKTDPHYRPNVEALQEVQPPWEGIAGLHPNPRANWVPPEVIKSFAERALGLSAVHCERVANETVFAASPGTETDSKFEGGGMYASQILDSIINDRKIVVKDRVRDASGSYTSVVNPQKTATANQAKEEIIRAFDQYVKTTGDKITVDGKEMSVPDAAEQSFNRVVGGWRPPTFKGDWITLPGQSGEIYLDRGFRKAVLARLLTYGNGMIAHGVGSGKTMTQIALVMEMRRLGKAKKPVIVVEKSTIGQFSSSFRRAYPQAKLLVAGESNFGPKDRARFLGMAQAGDWDAIIMTRPQVTKVPHSPDALNDYISRNLADLDAALAAAPEGSDTQSHIQTMRDRLQEQIKKMGDKLAENSDLTGVTWEKLGVDALVVDEAHNFKNTFVYTAKENIKNLPTGSFSQQAISMELKTSAIRNRNNGKGIFFATGTPVTNAMHEVWVMLNYIAPHILAENGVGTFDQFADTYGDLVTSPEATWKGDVKDVTRFAKFVHGQSLINMVRSVFDVAMGNENLGLDVPKVSGGAPKTKVLDQTPPMERVNDWIVNTVAREWVNTFGEKDEDGSVVVPAMQGLRDYIEANPWVTAVPIMTMQAGIAAALDPRLLHDGAEDHPGSKANETVRQILARYHSPENHEKKTTQVVFSDLRNSFRTDLLERFAGSNPFGDLGDNFQSFDLYEDIAKKLVKGGIPRDQIGWLEPGMSDEKKEAFFDKVNAGLIRVVIGGEGISTGVNLQERLGDAYHMMPPRNFKPAQMEQRNGRIIRQGNLFAEWGHNAFVDEAARLSGQKFDGETPLKRRKAAMDWLAKNDGDGSIREAADTAADKYAVNITELAMARSLDSAVYSMMAAKQGFIAQYLSGHGGSTFEDPTDAVQLSMARMAAESIGDPNLIQKIELDRQMKALRGERNTWLARGAELSSDVRSYEATLPSWGRQNEDLARTAEQAKDIYNRRNEKGEPIAPLYRFGDGTQYDAATSKKEDGGLYGAVNRYLMSVWANRRSGVNTAPGTLSINGHEFHISVDDPLAGGENGMPGRVTGLDGSNHEFRGAQSLMTKLRNHVTELPDKAADAQYRHEGATKRYQRAKDALALHPQHFEKEDEFQRITDELQNVRQRIGSARASHVAELRAARALSDGGEIHPGESYEDTTGAESDFENEGGHFLNSQPINHPEFDFDNREQPEEPNRTPAERFKAALPLADQIANAYSNIPGVQMDDVRQNARIALVKAAQRYDTSSGSRFEPYARTVINNSLKDLYRHQALNREDTTLDAPTETQDGEGESRKDVLRDSSQDTARVVQQREAYKAIRDSVGQLPDRLQSVINGILSGRTLDDIGEELGITKQGVSKLASVAMEKLRGKLGERGVKGSDDLLGSQSLENAINAHLKAQETGDPLAALSELLEHGDIQDWIAKAGREKSGERTIGRPDLALGADGPAMMGVDESRKATAQAQTNADWQKEGEAMLKRDYDGTVRMLASRGLAGATLNPSETKAAQMIVAREMSLPLTPERQKRVASVLWAYRETGTAAGRELAARVDPFKTPVDRHREFLAKIMFTPPPEVQREINTAETPAEKKAILDKDQERVEKVKAALNKMGVSFDDILNGEVDLRLRGSQAVKNVVSGFGPQQQHAFRMLQGGAIGLAEIAKKSGLTEAQVKQVHSDFIEQMRRKHFAKFAAGMKAEDVDMSPQSTLFSQASEPSDSEKEAEFQKMIRMMGVVPIEDLGKMKVVRRKKAKLFTPPTPKGPYTGPVPSDAPMERESRTEQDLLNPERNKVRQPTGVSDTGRTDGKQVDLGIRTPYEGPTPGDEAVNMDGARQSKLGLDSGFDQDAWHETMVRKGADLGNVDDVVRLSRAVQAANGNAFDMVHEYWINSILSGPTSHLTYKMSTIANTMWDMTVQRGMEAMLNMVYNDSDSAQLGEFRHIAAGFLPGIVRGFRLGVRQFSTEAELFEHEALNQQTEMFESSGKFGDRKPAIGGKAGRIIRMPTRALKFIDGLSKGWIGQMEAGAQAYRIAKSEGLKGPALSQRINELVATPGSEAWHRAVEHANELTFQNPILDRANGGNAFDNAIKQFSTARNGSMILGYLFPFIRLPYNIFKTGVRKSPFGTVSAVSKLAQAGFYKIRDGKPVFESYSAASQTHDFAEQLIAWSTAAMLYSAVTGDADDDKKGFLITGSMPRTEVKGGIRDLAQRAYGGPYQIRIGGRNGFTFNYGKMEPFATVLGTMADSIAQLKKMHQLSAKTSATDKAKMAADGMWGYFLAQAQEKTFLKGFDTVSRLIDGSSSIAEEGKKMLLDALVPNLIRQPLRNWDDFLRDSKHAEAAYQTLPAAGNATEKIDAWGRPVAKDGNKLSRMFFPSGAKPYAELEKADELLMSWNRQMPMEAWAPQVPTDTYRGADGKNAKMTAEQYKRYSIMAGTRARDILRGRISDSQIRKPSEADIKMVKEAFTEAHEQAKAQLFPAIDRRTAVGR